MNQPQAIDEGLTFKQVWAAIQATNKQIEATNRQIKYLALKGEVCCSPDVVALRGLILF